MGNRFHYKIFRGHGPSSGWISTKLKGKQLLIPADVRDTGRFLNSTAPIPELFYVQPSEKHGTFREIRGAGVFSIHSWELDGEIALKFDSYSTGERVDMYHLLYIYTVYIYICT